ncbi:MAG: hypothetical protein JWP66_332 [Naasia sp.]|nr:hypothetical protein [Naasia sp.]
MRRRAIPRAAALAAAIGALAGCASPPTTTYTAANGASVTVDWREYPGHADQDPDQVLQAPVAEEVAERAENVLGAIERRLAEEFGFDWEDGPGESVLVRTGGNGYGGDSLYVVYNSTTRESLTVPDFADWNRVLEIVDAVAPAYGFEPVRLDSVSVTGEEYGVGPEQKDEKGAWQWNGVALAPGQWLSVGVVDVERDASGEAAEEMAGSVEHGWNPRSVSLSYGATTLHHRDRASFLERLAPFQGLPRPEPTTSD